MKILTPYFSEFSIVAAAPLSAEQLKIIGIKYPAVETKLQKALVEKTLRLINILNIIWQETLSQ